MNQSEKDAFVALLNDYSTYWLTLYGEFRGESVEAQIAGGNIILNRYSKNGKSIKDVCLAPLQFSCWNLNDPNLDKLEKVYNQVDLPDRAVITQIQYVVKGLVSSQFIDNTHGATHYITTALLMSPSAPEWSHRLNPIAIIGKTTFLK